MDIGQEIARRVEALPLDQQQLVLTFVDSLSGETGSGEGGVILRQFASLLDSDSAREITEAIESECEQIDAGDW